jgi:predicted PurR-regulated permease PerM
MEFLTNLFGNLTSGIIRLAVTVGILAAVYFFIVKPTTDTANNAFDSISEPLKQAEEQAAQAQEQLKQNANSGAPGSKSDLNQLDRLQRCVQKAHQNVAVLQRCAERFGP